MSQEKIYAYCNSPVANVPVIFNPDVCNGCNNCLDVCQMDVLMPNPEPGKPPVVMYPDECWYAGCCVAHCPKREEGAVVLNLPIMSMVRWKRKSTGEHFRLKIVP